MAGERESQTKQANARFLMRSIFLKIFMYFWLATILSGVVFFLIAINLRLSPMRDERKRHFASERQRIVGEALTLYGRTAAAVNEREGSPASVDAGQGVGAKGYLFAADGSPISQGAPQPLREAVLRAAKGPRPPERPVKTIVVVRVQGPSGAQYLAAALLPPGPPPPEIKPFPLPPHFWLQLFITFIVSGLVCYGLSWRLTAPVRRLRAATQGLADGALKSRVDVPMKGPGDEITGLGRDFNLMAARIEKLVLAHKQLVRDASHELRSPLARLNVALGLARKESPASAARSLDRIEHESDRLNLLITEILTLSKLEEGIDVARGEFDLSELVEEVARDAEFEACALNRQVRCEAMTAIPFQGSRELLSRALENVVRNGVRYTEEGTAVEILLEREADAVVLRVRDHGPGVPEEQLADIFRPFYRVAQARDRNSGGTGIGLAIAERTVALHGGAIAARNALGGGLEVEIRLPFKG